jgi:hypothetical protein
MKAEADPITEDEWLIRLVWETKVKRQEPLIAATAFEPLPYDTDGLSLFRLACLNDPSDALLAVAEDKRPRYAVVQIPVSLLATLGLTVRPAPIPEVRGHVVVPEINVTAYKADKARFTPIKQRLAEVAGGNVIRKPAGSSSG